MYVITISSTAHPEAHTAIIIRVKCYKHILCPAIFRQDLQRSLPIRLQVLMDTASVKLIPPSVLTETICAVCLYAPVKNDAKFKM